MEIYRELCRSRVGFRPCCGKRHARRLAVFACTAAFFATLAFLPAAAGASPGDFVGDQDDAVFLSSRTLRVPADRALAVRALTEIPARSRRHVILQLDHLPNAAARRGLQASGIRLLQYLQNRGWYASVTGGLESTSPGLAKVHGSWSIEPGDRLYAGLRKGVIPEHAIAPDGRLMLSVIAFDDVNLDALQAQIEALGGTVDSVVGSFHTLFVRIPRSALRGLAKLDDVQWIESVAPKPQPEMYRARNFLHQAPLMFAPYGLSGAGVEVGVHDEAHAFEHDDLLNRWVQGDLAAGQPLLVDVHPSMTAGTIAGDGSMDSNNMGMAPQATIVTYSYGVYGSAGWEANNLGDIEAAQARGVDVANNSWGYGCPGQIEGLPYGDYTAQSRVFDLEVLGKDSLGNILGDPVTVVFSAGNERNKAECVPHDTAPFINYGTINQPKPAKNPIVVGAVDSYPLYPGRMTAFSGWGPVSDGRLKPDLVAAGVHQGADTAGVSELTPELCWASFPRCYRTTNSNNTDFGGYAWFGWTSAAAAMVSGNAALFVEDFRALTGGRNPLPSTVKAHFVHTANDLDDATNWYNPGPDYSSGYGVLNIQAAIDQLRTGGWAEACVDQGETKSLRLQVPLATPEVRITLAWDDVPAAPSVTTPALINDLDLVVTDAVGVRHFPWTLDPNIPDADAVRTVEDHLNNVEMVVAPAADGEWRIEVVGTSVPSGPQCFSLVYSPQALGLQEPVTQSWTAAHDVYSDLVHDMVVDGMGHVVVSGGDYGYLTVKYDVLGREMWAQRAFTSSGTGAASTALAVDAADNVLVTGTHGTVKYDSNGNELWRKAYPDASAPIDAAAALAVDNAGNAYVGGAFDGDFVLIKYLPNGTRDWYRLYDGPGGGRDEIKALTLDADGNIYVTGASDGATASIYKADFATIKYDPSGTRLWNPAARYNGPADGNDVPVDIALDGLGNVYVSGESLGTDTDRDFATVKYGPNGAELWVERQGSGSREIPSALEVDANGNAYVTGSVGAASTSNYLTVKYDTDGSKQWSVIYNGPGNDRDYATDLAVDAQGNVYVTGASINVTGSGTDYLTIKYNPDGGRIWEARYNCFGWDSAQAIALDGENNVYVTGNGACFDTAENYITIQYQQGDSTTLAAGVEGAGSGTISSNPPGIDCGLDCTEVYALGSQIELTATPDAGSYFVGWGGDCNGSGACLVGMDAQHVVTATFGQVPLVFIDDATLTELLDGTSEAVFPVALTRPISAPVAIDYATADGTATVGTDYNAASGLLDFPPGVTARTITVTLPDVLPPVGDKTFFVNLDNPVNVLVGDGQAQATISAISPETRAPADHGYVHDEQICTDFGWCDSSFDVFTGVEPQVYSNPWNGLAYQYEVGLAEFDIRGIAPGLDSAHLNFTFDRFDPGGFWVSYLPLEGDGIIDQDDYYACRNVNQRIHLEWVGSADQKRVDVREALQWAITNGFEYLTFCFHEGVERRLYVFDQPTMHSSPSNDLDLDGVTNGIDNCLLTANATQADFDQDGQGDACDGDDDNDGLTDDFELVNNLDPYDADMDDDGLTDYEEACYDSVCSDYRPGVTDTDATLPDTDGGAKGDYLEVLSGTNALNRWDDLVVCETPVQLTHDSVNDSQLAINADGTRVAYRGCDNGVGSSCYGNNLIYAVAFDDGVWTSPVQISNTTRWNSLPVINGDGTKVAYTESAGGNSLYLAEYRDGAWQAPVKLVGTEVIGGDVRWPSISADGQRIFYYACDADPINNCATGDYEIYLMKYDAVALQWLGPVQITDNSVADYEPVTNADGTRIAYIGCSGGTGYNCEGGSLKLYYTEELGGVWQTPITLGDNAVYLTSERRLAMNADGTRILYVAHDGVNTTMSYWDVYRVDYADGGWQPPVNMGGTSGPSLNADGMKMAFYPWTYLEYRDGSWLGPIPVIGTGDRDQTLSADGTTSAYRSSDGYDYEVFVTRCVAAAIDSDGDGIFDDGDWSGSVTDNFCSGQSTAYCDDNCPHTLNTGQQETDGDGVGDDCDLCTLTPNPEQRDTDGDGYGNLCDGDLNNDGSTNTLDLNLYKQSHRTSVGNPNYNPDADFNGDGTINTLDLNIYKDLHRKPPGPSCCVN